MSGGAVTCRQFVELLSDYLEHALDEPVATAFEDHLALCAGCETYLEQMDAVLAALRTLPPESVPADILLAVSAALTVDGRANGAK